jgi:hypothetical protein
MSNSGYLRARHNSVNKLLTRLNSGFLGDAKCYFGGGTRIVLELNEYRESADIDFLCSDREGYRALRSTIRPDSLGEIASAPFKFLREIRTDQYGLRTVIEIDRELIKFEIVNEARIDLSGLLIERLHVPCLDRVCCFAEKLLANDDRGLDESVASRDVIDIAFMIEAWGMRAFIDGADKACDAYSKGAEASLRASALKLLENKTYFKKCVTAHAISDVKTLVSGLHRIVARDWRASPRKRAVPGPSA